MLNVKLAEVLEASGIGSDACLVTANDALRARMAHMARENRPVPADLREAADAVEAELMEAKFDNLPV